VHKNTEERSSSQTFCSLAEYGFFPYQFDALSVGHVACDASEKMVKGDQEARSARRQLGETSNDSHSVDISGSTTNSSGSSNHTNANDIALSGGDSAGSEDLLGCLTRLLSNNDVLTASLDTNTEGNTEVLSHSVPIVTQPGRGTVPDASQGALPFANGDPLAGLPPPRGLEKKPLGVGQSHAGVPESKDSEVDDCVCQPGGGKASSPGSALDAATYGLCYDIGSLLTPKFDIEAVARDPEYRSPGDHALLYALFCKYRTVRGVVFTPDASSSGVRDDFWFWVPLQVSLGLFDVKAVDILAVAIDDKSAWSGLESDVWSKAYALFTFFNENDDWLRELDWSIRVKNYYIYCASSFRLVAPDVCSSAPVCQVLDDSVVDKPVFQVRPRSKIVLPTLKDILSDVEGRVGALRDCASALADATALIHDSKPFARLSSRNKVDLDSESKVLLEYFATRNPVIDASKFTCVKDKTLVWRVDKFGKFCPLPKGCFQSLSEVHKTKIAKMQQDAVDAFRRSSDDAALGGSPAGVSRSSSVGSAESDGEDSVGSEDSFPSSQGSSDVKVPVSSMVVAPSVKKLNPFALSSLPPGSPVEPHSQSFTGSTPFDFDSNGLDVFLRTEDVPACFELMMRRCLRPKYTWLGLWNYFFSISRWKQWLVKRFMAQISLNNIVFKFCYWLYTGGQSPFIAYHRFRLTPCDFSVVEDSEVDERPYTHKNQGILATSSTVRYRYKMRLVRAMNWCGQHSLPEDWDDSGTEDVFSEWFNLSNTINHQVLNGMMYGDVCHTTLRTNLVNIRSSIPVNLRPDLQEYVGTKLFLACKYLSLRCSQGLASSALSLREVIDGAKRSS